MSGRRLLSDLKNALYQALTSVTVLENGEFGWPRLVPPESFVNRVLEAMRNEKENAGAHKV